MKKLITLFGLIISIISCNKTRTYYLSDYLKLTANVDSGSFFVYKDSITNEIDTCWVIGNYGPSIYQTNAHHRNSTPVYSEALGYKMSISRLFPDSFICNINITARAIYSKTNALLYAYKSNKKFYFSQDARIYSEPFFDKIKESYGDEAKNNDLATGTYNMLNLYGRTYQTVFENLHVYSDSFKSIYTQKDTFVYKELHTYFSLDDGLIKFSIRQDSTYIVKELIHSSIIRKQL